MTVFVFDSETGVLAHRASPAEALQGMSRELLRSQRWLFFAEDGAPLRVDCLADGSCQMRPWASCSSCRLEQLLPWIREIQGAPWLPDVDALRSHLAARGSPAL